MGAYACARCQDWGTLIPGDDRPKSADMPPGSIGAGLEYCDCPAGQSVRDASRQGRPESAGPAETGA